jgi:GNAT superfamily N-acetyltransferase
MDVEIRELDIGDDLVLRDAYDLMRRSEILGRPTVPYWSFEEFRGAVRAADGGERQELLGAYDGAVLTGTALLYSFLLDNTDKAWVKINVDPQARRRGIGRALVDEVEQRVKADSRTMLLGEARLPFGERETHGYRSFAEVCGYELANIEVVRNLALPVEDSVIQGWIDSAAPAHEGYTIETLVDEIPDDLVEDLCVLIGQLAVDAPTGAVDFEEEVFTPERLRERREAARAMGRSVFETVALTPERQVVAHSTLAVSANGSSTDVYQWGTFVHREHRGHRLGLATKAHNLRAVQSAYPEMSRVTTQNAETNGYMVSINETMGFVADEVVAEFFKKL